MHTDNTATPVPATPIQDGWSVDALRDGEWVTASSGWGSKETAMNSARILNGTLGEDVVVVDPYGNDVALS